MGGRVGLLDQNGRAFCYTCIWLAFTEIPPAVAWEVIIGNPCSSIIFNPLAVIQVVSSRDIQSGFLV